MSTARKLFRTPLTPPRPHAFDEDTHRGTTRTTRLEAHGSDVGAKPHIRKGHALEAALRDAYGRTSSVPCPMSATSPPTFTFSTLPAVPSGCTRRVLGRPVKRP
jgi:hypothetical protein